jgi:hypothetical protein
VVDQMRNLEKKLWEAEKRVNALETALTAIQELGGIASRRGTRSAFIFCAGRMQQIAEFALNPDTLETARKD